MRRIRTLHQTKCKVLEKGVSMVPSSSSSYTRTVTRVIGVEIDFDAVLHIRKNKAD